MNDWSDLVWEGKRWMEKQQQHPQTVQTETDRGRHSRQRETESQRDRDAVISEALRYRLMGERGPVACLPA